MENRPTNIYYYTETDEIEICCDDNYVAYFDNVRDLAKLIKTNPRLVKDLIKILREGE